MKTTLETQITNYFTLKIYSKDKMVLGNEIISNFTLLQDMKKELIIQDNNEEGLAQFKKDISKIETDNVFDCGLIKLGQNNGSFNFKHINSLNIEELYNQFALIVSIERKYFSNPMILSIIERQIKIIGVMCDVIHYLVKKHAITTHYSEIKDLEQHMYVAAIRKLYTYKNMNFKFSTYISNELKFQKTLFCEKQNELTTKKAQIEFEDGIEELTTHSNPLDSFINDKFHKEMKAILSNNEYKLYEYYIINEKSSSMDIFTKKMKKKIENHLISKRYI